MTQANPATQDTTRQTSSGTGAVNGHPETGSIVKRSVVIAGHPDQRLARARPSGMR